MVSITPTVILVGAFIGILCIALITLSVHTCRRRKTRPTNSGNDVLQRPYRGSGFQRSPTIDGTFFSEKSPTPSQVSFTLSPNQPVYVDVESEGGAQVGMQLVLTPPTPAKQQRFKREDSSESDGDKDS